MFSPDTRRAGYLLFFHPGVYPRRPRTWPVLRMQPILSENSLSVTEKNPEKMPGFLQKEEFNKNFPQMTAVAMVTDRLLTR